MQKLKQKETVGVKKALGSLKNKLVSQRFLVDEFASVHGQTSRQSMIYFSCLAWKV